MFRRLSVGLGGFALGLGTLWAYGLVEALDRSDAQQEFVTQQKFVTWQAIVGCVGVAALLLAACCAFAHANTGHHRWLSWVALSALSALPLFGGWIFLGILAGSR